MARSELNHSWDNIQEAIKTIMGGGAIQAGIISCQFQLTRHRPLCIPVFFDRLEQLGVPIVLCNGVASSKFTDDKLFELSHA